MTEKAAENNIPDFAKKKAYIERLRPIDDVMFEILAKDPEVCEEILKVILEDPKLKVLSVTPQDSIKNLYGRSVRLDALCELSTGETVNVEVQRSDNDNHLMRARYNLSCITANIMEPGAKFEKVPTVCFVYISEFDVFGENKTTYHVDSVIRETGTVVDDKCYRIFVNTKVKDETEISKLMEHFMQNNFSDPDFPKLSETSVYKGYKQDKIEMRGDRAEMSDFPLYLNTVAGGLDRRDQTIGGFSFVVKIYAVPVVEIIG